MLLRRKGYGQPIRVDGPQSHQTKRGTPTMGGAVFVVASLIGYAVAHAATDDPLTASGVLVLLLMVGLGAVGFIDDYMKVFRQTSVGLRSRAKLAGQIIIAIVFAFEVLRRPDGFALDAVHAGCSRADVSCRGLQRTLQSKSTRRWP